MNRYVPVKQKVDGRTRIFWRPKSAALAIERACQILRLYHYTFTGWNKQSERVLCQLALKYASEREKQGTVLTSDEVFILERYKRRPMRIYKNELLQRVFKWKKDPKMKWTKAHILAVTLADEYLKLISEEK